MTPLEPGSALIAAGLMFGLGTGLDPAQFRALGRAPRAAALGLAGQLVGVPLLALAAVYLGGLTGGAALGMLVLAACPGGIVSNAYAALARADVALSVSLTAASTMIAAWTLPLWVGVGAGALGVGALPDGVGWTLAARTLGLSVLPVAAGMGWRALRPRAADRLQGPVRYALGAVIALMLVGAVVTHGHALLDGVARLALPVVGLNLAGYALGGLLGLIGRLPAPQRVTLALEVGLQNGPLATGLGLALGGADAALPALLYGPWMLLTGGALAWLAGRRAG